MTNRKPLLWASLVIEHAGVFYDVLDLRDREPLYDFIDGVAFEVDFRDDAIGRIGLGLFPAPRASRLLGVHWVTAPRPLAGDSLTVAWAIKTIDLPIAGQVIAGAALRRIVRPEFHRLCAQTMKRKTAAKVVPWSSWGTTP